jgi:hypothetical protein
MIYSSDGDDSLDAAAASALALLLDRRPDLYDILLAQHGALLRGNRAAG